jgi:hypothetical protein
MIHRCYHSYHHKFPIYGGRGIRVCDAWRADIRNFLADLPERPSPRHTIDRIDPDGHYEPGNVKWSTAQEQARNRRDNRRETIDGVEKLVIEWAEEFDVSPSAVVHRLNRGWNIMAALYHPKHLPTHSIERRCRQAWPSYLDHHKNIDTAPVAPV